MGAQQNVAMSTASTAVAPPGVLVLQLGPECRSIDEDAIVPLHALFEQRFAEATPRVVVLDLSHVTRACSSFLGLLARWWKELRDRGHVRLAVCGASPGIRDRLAVTGLTALWPMFGSREDAIAALQDGA